MTKEKKCIKFVRLTLRPGEYLYVEGEEKPRIVLQEEIVAFYILEGELYAQANNSFRTGRYGPKEFVGTEGFIRRIGTKDRFPYRNTVFTNPDKKQNTILVGFTYKGMVELFRTQPVAAFQMVAGWVRRTLEVEEEFIDYVSNTYKTPIIDEIGENPDVKKLSGRDPEELARIIVSLQKNLREANSLFLAMQQQERMMNRQIDDLSKNLNSLLVAFKQLSKSFLEQTSSEQPFPIRVDLEVDDAEVDEIFEVIIHREDKP